MKLDKSDEKQYIVELSCYLEVDHVCDLRYEDFINIFSRCGMLITVHQYDVIKLIKEKVLNSFLNKSNEWLNLFRELIDFTPITIIDYFDNSQENDYFKKKLYVERYLDALKEDFNSYNEYVDDLYNKYDVFEFNKCI